MILHVKEKDYTTVGSQFISPISWFSAGMHYFEAQHATVHGITKSWTRLGGNNIFLIYILFFKCIGINFGLVGSIFCVITFLDTYDILF